jgi:hypothetical protein
MTQTKKLTVVNKKVQLSYRVFTLGHTDKTEQEGLIGGHGRTFRDYELKS